ncbi:MAG: hypothetical protein M3R25_11595 [Bacteroidota bacterium]|nr:hypothetical protein [Bacteroidota bacterium]
MGAEHFDTLKRKVGQALQFEETSYETLPTYENFFYQHEGYFQLNQGNGAELQLTLPGGNYEIEAIVRLYNNSEERIVYSCSLDYFLDDAVRSCWEGGEIGSTLNSKPYVLQFKTMAKFTTSKVIKFKLGGAATSGFLADKPMIMVRRIGAIRYTSD